MYLYLRIYTLYLYTRIVDTEARKEDGGEKGARVRGPLRRHCHVAVYYGYMCIYIDVSIHYISIDSLYTSIVDTQARKEDSGEKGARVRGPHIVESMYLSIYLFLFRSLCTPAMYQSISMRTHCRHGGAGTGWR